MSTSLPSGALPASYHVYEAGVWREVDAAIVEERVICIHVNGQELATYMCSPIEQKALALGFLRSEDFIDSLDDVAIIEVIEDGQCVDVWLNKEVRKPEREIKTSGCGGGVTFDDLTRQRPPLASTTFVSTAQVENLYQQLRSLEVLYPLTRGIHSSALCSPDQILLTAEDVGRHNTLDKLWGKALMSGVPTDGRLILTTGRVSSEMLGKAAKMGVQIVASRTSPTSRSLALAQAWNITLIGYLRRGGMHLYSAPDRVLDITKASPPAV
ncbi:MAG: formate dehydrogenase accessory sulfurtransferase FdhD [Caldilineales bacterium]|nr:formate dehydrogenase accessory sulfurtransferase FdhD [Caldilineales bacterium]